MKVNSILKNEYTFLVGYYEHEEFWCTGEYNEFNEENARNNFERLKETHPDKHVELIQQIKMHKIVDHYYPKNNENN